MDPASRPSRKLPHQSRPPLPSGSPSAANRFARHPHSPFFRLSTGHRPSVPSLDFPSNGLHPRPPTPFVRSDPLPHKPSSLHTRSFSYDDPCLSKDRTVGSLAYSDLDDIIARSASSHCLVDPCSASAAGAVADQLTTGPHHQRSLSVPATPVGPRPPSRVRFEISAMSCKVGAHRMADRRPAELPTSPGATTRSTPPTNTGSASSTELPATELDPFRPAEIDLYHPLPPDTTSLDTGRPSSPQQQPPRPSEPSSPAILGHNQPQQQPDLHPPTHSQPATTTTDLPPQAYPGKRNPLLPPPTPAPSSARQICFPRPFRRRLSLQPAAIQLPPSPPPEFDFSSFENPLPQSDSSSLFYSLVDDSPCMSNHSVNQDLSGRPLNLIDLTDNKQEQPTGTGKSQHSPHGCQLPSRTPYSHFTPLSSPVISERPYLPSLLSSPLTEYVPSRYRNRADDLNQDSPRQKQNGSELSEILRSINESISNSDFKPTSQKSTPRERSPRRRPTPPQTSSDSARGPAERQTAHRSASHTPRNQSSSRAHSKPASFPPSPAPLDRVVPATVASSKRSHSRAPSVHWSPHHSPPTKSGAEPLTEEALRLHQSSASGNSGNPSQAGPGRPGGDVPASPRPTDGESRVTRWELGEAKDDELASLVESINQRNEERSQMLTGLLRAVSREIQEHDREAEAETAMVRRLSRSRQSQLGRGSPRELGELAGEECGGSQFSVPLSTLNKALPPPTSIRETTFSPALERLSHLNSRRSSLAGDVTASIRDASVAAGLHAQALMDNIRSRASSIRASAKAAEMASDGHTRQEDATGPGSGAETPKATSVAGMTKVSSAAGTVKAPSEAGTVKARSAAGTVKAPSEAGTVKGTSVAAPDKQESVAGSTKARSTRTAASVHEPLTAPIPSAPASCAQSRAPSQRDQSRAPSHRDSLAAPCNRTASRAPSTRAPSLREPSAGGNSQNLGVAGSAKAPSVSGSAKAPSVTGTAKAGSTKAASVAGSAKPPSAAGTPKAESIAAGSVKSGTAGAGTARAPSVAGSKAAGTVRAPSVASVRTATAAASIRAPTEVVEEQQEDERPESAVPPSVAEEAADGAAADGGGEAAEEAPPADQQPGEEQPADEQPGEAQPADNDPNPPASVNDTLVKSGPATLVGEVVGGEQPVHEDEHKAEPMLKRPIVPTAVNPLGEWIRFGRAGFKFHILDPSPPPELDEPPAKQS